MAVYHDSLTAFVTHQDICQLFGLDENDLPTSAGYQTGLLSNSLDTYIPRAASIGGRVNGWHKEITQSAGVYSYGDFTEQTSSGMDCSIMALLETAVLTQNVVEFQFLVDTISWSKQPQTDLITAIRMALTLEAPLIARKLAVKGVKLYPVHLEMKKIASILAEPTVTTVATPSKLDPKANKMWIQANRKEYRGKWVALYNGELIDSSQNISELITQVGDIKGKGILVTQVT